MFVHGNLPKHDAGQGNENINFSLFGACLKSLLLVIGDM